MNYKKLMHAYLKLVQHIYFLALLIKPSILPIKSSTSKSPRSAIILIVATLAITFTIGVFNFSNLGFKEIK